MALSLSCLRDLGKPLGISEFRHLETLLEQLKGTLPTLEEIAAELFQVRY